MIQKLIPSNLLENKLCSAQAGELDFQDVIKIFLKSEIFIPSTTKITQGKFSPILFDKETEKMMAGFTSLVLLKSYSKHIKEYLFLNGLNLLEQIPNGCGLVINPGYDVGFDVSSRGIREIIQDFSDSANN